MDPQPAPATARPSGPPAVLRRLVTSARLRRFAWRAFLVAQWVLVPALVVAAVRHKTRAWPSVAHRPPGAAAWDSFEKQAAGPPLDCLFVGSSRVAAAVDTDAFARAVSDRLGRPARVANFGLGYSTMALHYLNLRNLVEQNHRLLRGCTVFIEAPGGLPADPGKWDGPWCHGEHPEMLAPLLRPRDLPGLWWRHDSLEGSVRVTFDVLTGRVPLLSNRDLVGKEFVLRGNQWVERRLGRFLPKKEDPPPAAPAAADLTTAGGIRNDAAGVAAARQLAESLARKELDELRPVRFDDDCILAELVRLIQKAGGNVIFFEMPLHAVQAEVHATPTRREDRRAFEEKARAWGCELLSADFVAKDDDFPDTWHLRLSLAPAFSRVLARAWLGAGGK